MIGNQTPRLRIEPARVGTDGGDAALLMSAYSHSLDAWQQLILECWLGTDDDGCYTVTSGGISVPRQNGKNGILEAREFFGMVVKGERILHTAHQTKTSKRSFRRVEAMFTNKRHPEIIALVKDIRYTNGEECIELHNGGRIEFSTRTRQSARGFDGISLVVYDEAQELTDEQVEATMATLAASATNSRQILYAGTPPYPGCPGDVFRRVRSSAMSGSGERESWHEWGVAGENVDAINVSDPALWYEANPALGVRLTEEFTASELRTMSKDGFCRERLGWWPPVITQKTDYAIPEAVWDACVSHDLKPEGKTAYGVKFTLDGSEVALCGAVIPTNGPARISLIARRPTGAGMQWLADWLNERYAKSSCVVIDGKNGADVLVEKIVDTWKAKDCIIRPGGKHILAATSVLTNSLNEKTVTWYFGQDDLRSSAISSVKRPISGGWGFGGENSAPIEAASLALWGAKSSKRDPNRKMRIG